jgi:hypothetical protein
MGPALKIDVMAQHVAVKWNRKMQRFTPVMLTNGRKAAIYNSIIRIDMLKLFESISMRKTIYFILLITVFLTGTAKLQAADLEDGFFDLAWKTDLSQTDGFRKISENVNVSYFINPKRAYKIADVKIMDVLYGSFANQFFAVYINIEAIDVFAQLRRYINHKYGPPKKKFINMAKPDQQTVYQWKYKKTKIKLKIYRNRENMKMAFYFTPLSVQVNEEQQEAFQENNRKPIFPLNETRMQQAEELRDLMRF